MDWQYFVDRFYFKNNLVFDNDIGSIRSLETNALVNEMQFDLPFKSQTRARQFKLKTIFISMLKKPWADRAMNFDRYPNHPSDHLFPCLLYTSRCV